MYARLLRLFTGAVYVDYESNVLLTGEIVFANNTAGDGGMTVK